jgi:hypothetical protein
VNENTLKACFLGLLAVTIVVLGTLITLGHNSAITDSLLVVSGGVGTLGVWERLKSRSGGS